MAKIKTKSELLKAYMKANKDRREIIANRAGFNSGDEYKSHLKAQIEKETTENIEVVSENVVVHNVHILDASYSMEGSRMRSALQGINSEISELKKDNSVKYLQTVVYFSGENQYYMPIDRRPIETVGEVVVKTLNMTALYSAIGKTLEHLVTHKKPNEKTIVKVFTDGNENASRGKYRRSENLRDFIKTCEGLDITVSFVGTKTDVATVVNRLGIDESNTLSHDNTKESIDKVFVETMTATKSYVGKSLRGESTLTGFYKQSGTL